MGSAFFFHIQSISWVLYVSSLVYLEKTGCFLTHQILNGHGFLQVKGETEYGKYFNLG